MMKIQVVTNRATESVVFDSFEAMEAAGFKRNGRTGPAYLREEIRDQPCFEGLAGPMWGGEKHPIRYEDASSCELLSS